MKRSHMEELIEEFNVFHTSEKAHTQRNGVDLLWNGIDHVLKLMQHELKSVLQFVKPKIRVILSDFLDVVFEQYKMLFYS